MSVPMTTLPRLVGCVAILVALASACTHDEARTTTATGGSPNATTVAAAGSQARPSTTSGPSGGTNGTSTQLGGSELGGASSATGGSSSVGGANATNVATSAAGSKATGGSAAAGGKSSNGGSTSTGGVTSTGGRAANAGATSVATGGATSAGGNATTGGSAVVAGASNCVTKRGFASVLAVSTAPGDLAALAAPVSGVSWYYGWAKAPSSQVGTSYVNAGVEFVPMIWGKSAELTDTNLASKIQVGTKTRYLLGFNEPNFNSQANLTPAQAAAAWPNVEKAADQLGLELVGPAVNFCGGGCNVTDPFQWMDQFLAACTNCRIDYLAFHSYACDSKWFLDSYMKPAVKKYYTEGKPSRKIWVTEFACADSPPSGGWTVTQIDSYVRTVLDYFEKEPGIFRYAWFGGDSGRTNDSYVTANNNLLAVGASQLTSLGTTYTSMAEAKSCP